MLCPFTQQRGSLLLGGVARKALWWGAYLAVLAGADSNDMIMDGARHTVLDLVVELGDGEPLDHACVEDIVCNGIVHYIANGESLNYFVLGNAAVAVLTANDVRVSAVIF